jgi:flagellar basal-body rod protein FlgB
MDWLNSVPIAALSKNLDGLWARERVISENISNYETPDYKSKYVAFEQDLLFQLQKNNLSPDEKLQDISTVKVNELLSDSQSLREDGNNVDLEAETIEMAQTQLNYLYSVQSINEYFARLRTAING